MKILLVITGLGVGGAERLVTCLADKFASLGHDVVIAYLQGTATLKPSDGRVQLVCLGMSRNPSSLARGVWRLRQLINAFKPDVINSHLIHANILARLVRVVTPLPRLISSAHNNNEGSHLRFLAYRFTDHLADISTNVSDAAVAAFLEKKAVKPGRMITIHNGIDTEIFKFDPEGRSTVRRQLGVSDSQAVVLAVGRLSEAKDYPTLLRSFATVNCPESQPVLIIAGEGPLKECLVRFSDALGISERVHFLGIRHDVSALMSACDVFALSSAWEGFGLVVAEAMACERVVVATDCGGVSEVVGSEGWLVPPGNSGKFTLALESALSISKHQREKQGSNARARVEKYYSLDAAAQKWLQIYRQV